jgi:UDP-2,3-diacylglucosamine pyrophosphatase LpxH
MSNLNDDKVEETDSIAKYRALKETANDDSVTRVVDDLSNFDTIVVVFVGDWHIGSVDFDLEGAMDVLNYVLKTPNSRLFVLGDIMNTAILNSVSNMFEDIAYPQDQWELFVDLFKQVASQDKIEVIHTGNHERRIAKQTGIDPVSQVATALNEEDKYAPYFGETHLIMKCLDMPCGCFDTTIVTHHGDGGNPEALTGVNKDTLVNATGHAHVFQIWTKTILNYDEKTGCYYKKIELEVVIPANGGGMYGNEKGYSSIYKAPYFALELTTASNSRYDPKQKGNIREPRIVLAKRSLDIKHIPRQYDKDLLIESANKVIEEKQQKTYKKMLEGLKVIVNIINADSKDAGKEIFNAINKKMGMIEYNEEQKLKLKPIMDVKVGPKQIPIKGNSNKSKDTGK